MYLFVLLMIYIKSEFSIFMYIYFKNFVWLFLLSAYISQGWFGGKINLKGNLSFIKFYLNLTYEQHNSLITQNFCWEPRLVIIPSYHVATMLLWIYVPASHEVEESHLDLDSHSCPIRLDHVLCLVCRLHAAHCS